MDTTNSTTQPKRLSLSILVPTNPQVEYHGQTKLSIVLRNNSRERLLVEFVTLRFQPDAGAAPISENRRCDWELGPEKVGDQVVTISPSPLYLENTNAFEVMVNFRVITSEGLSAPESEKHRGSYLIIRSPTRKFGQVFISFKQPEDLGLARIMEKLAFHAGFLPYLAIADPQTGALLWDKIELAIKASVAAFVIWTNNTQWGEGVDREVVLCRKYKVPEVLLIERGAAQPRWSNEAVEHQHFDREDSASSFCTAVVARRKIILGQLTHEPPTTSAAPELAPVVTPSQAVTPSTSKAKNPTKKTVHKKKAAAKKRPNAKPPVNKKIRTKKMK